MLEDVSAGKQIENTRAVDLLVVRLQAGFHALVNPVAPLGRVDVVDFNADGAGVDGAGFAGVLALAFEFGRAAGAEKAERVQVAFEVSPLAVGVENVFAFWVGTVVRGTVDDRAGSLRFRGHKSAASRIKDAGETQKLHRSKVVALLSRAFPDAARAGRFRIRKLE